MDGKWTKVSMTIVAIMMISVGVFSAGCLDDETEGKIEYTDPTGNVVKLDGTPKSIVTLTPALTDIVKRLGAGDLIVGADNLSVIENPEMDLKEVLSYSSFDSEKLVELLPDLVLMDRTLDVTEANFNLIKNLNIPVYRVYPDGFDSILTIISDIGRILEIEEKAEEIVEDMKERRDTIQEKVDSIPMNERPIVLYVIYYDGTFDPYVGTSSSFSGDIIEISGGRNAIDDNSGVSVEVSVETIIDSDPDIIMTSMSFGSSAKTTILGKDTWQDITAVRNGEVHDIDGDHIDRSGPDLIIGLETIYSILYPQE